MLCTMHCLMFGHLCNSSYNAVTWNQCLAFLCWITIHCICMVYRIEPSAHQYLCTCWVAVVVQHHLGTYFSIHPIHVHTLLTQMHSLHWFPCKGVPYGHVLPPLHVPHFWLVCRWVVAGGGWRRWVHLSTTPECSTLHAISNTRWIPFKLQCYHWHRLCELIFHY